MRGFQAPQRHIDERGVTLMETLVVLAVMTTIMLLISQIFLSTFDVYAKQVARIEADTGTVFAARSISDLARGANAILASATIDGTLYETSATTLVLELPAADVDGALIPASYDRIAFARHPSESDVVISATDPAPGSARFAGTRVVTRNNAALVFRYDDPDPTQASRVSLLLINDVTVRGQTYDSPAWTSLTLRND